MIFDKRQGSLLNLIQLPLNVVTPYGTYLGVGYDKNNEPEYILSHVRVTTFELKDLVFSDFSKEYIMKKEKPILELTSDMKIGYDYEVTPTEQKYGYITVASKRISLDTGTITKAEANFILEKQLRHIGTVLENFITQPLGQPQYDALLIYFYYEGVNRIKDSGLIKMINQGDAWFYITDEIQTGIKRANGRVDEQLAARKMDIANMWSYVPGFS